MESARKNSEFCAGEDYLDDKFVADMLDSKVLPNGAELLTNIRILYLFVAPFLHHHLKRYSAFERERDRERERERQR